MQSYDTILSTSRSADTGGTPVIVPVTALCYVMGKSGGTTTLAILAMKEMVNLSGFRCQDFSGGR